MKKYFIIAVAAIVAMAACSKVETIDTPAKEVRFQAANYVPQTKAVSVLGDFTSFKCKAYLHAEGIDLNANGTVNGTSFQNFFGTAGETISPNNTTNPTEWAPSHTYYWPKGEKSFINFIGWYATDGTDPITPNISYVYDTDKWKATMEWSFSNSTVGANGYNILYADMAWRFKENDDTPQYGVSTNVSEGVPMLFHHALAQINVKAYASGTSLQAATGSVSDANATWTIALENVKITPINKTGTLTLTNSDPTPTATPGSAQTQAWTTSGWVGSDTAGDLATSYTQADPFNVDKITKESAADLIAATCVLPQTIGSSVVLSFNMRITTTYKTNPTNPNTELIPVSIKIGTDGFGTTAWEMNHKYTYYINIVPSQNKVLFDPALDAAWVVEDDVEKTI